MIHRVKVSRLSKGLENVCRGRLSKKWRQVTCELGIRGEKERL